MDTEKCRVLLTVLHERSLSAAAEALGYTPSGVSRLVDSLERETGFPLLHRGRGGVSATRACQELLPLMRRMAELDEQYQQLAHRIQGLDVGRVVAGTNYAAFYPWLSEVITLIPASGWSCGRAALLSWGSWWITGGRTSALSASGRDGTSGCR